MNNIELAVLAIALFLSTTSIFVYAWFECREKYLKTGIWALRITAVLPGLIATVWAIYVMATDEGSQLAMALLTAGMLLTAGAVQLLSLLSRKRGL